MLALCLCGSPVVAGEMIPPGDVALRADVEMLVAAGLLRGPVNAWPLPWSAIAGALATDVGVDARAAQAIRRLRTARDRDAASFAADVTTSVTNRPALVRDFGARARADADLAFRLSHRVGRLDLAYGVGFRDGQRGRDVHVEPVSVTLGLGNWAIYGGYVEAWWGPGNDGALLFSTASRPFPKLGFKRLSPEPFDLPLLRALGPWTLEAFAGKAEGRRADFQRPTIAGFRFAFAPAKGLEIGLNRGLQLCGENRPCSLGIIKDAVVGFGDGDNTGTPNEPGNQLAGFDVSYATRIGDVGVRLYAEAEAEDEDNVLVDKFARLAGATIEGASGDIGWRVGVEWADTLAIKAFGTTRYPGIVYQNFIYTDGFTNRGVPLGHGLGGDARLWSLSGSLTDAAARRFYASARKADLNRTGQSGFVSVNPESIHIGTVGVELPTSFGSIRAEARLQDDIVSSSGRTPYSGQVELSLRHRF
jgi:hypothetical protein